MSAQRKTFRREGEDHRRRELVRATLACIAELGMERTTVREIAIRAGVTPGLIRHYFEGKDDLVLAAYRHHIETMEVLSNQALAVAQPGGVARLAAFVAANLSAPVVDQTNLSLWAGFIETLRANAGMAAVHREGYLGYRRTAEHLITDAFAEQGRMAQRSEITRLGIALNALIDGLWLEGSLSPADFPAGELAAIGLASASALLGLRLRAPEAC